eukprot:TRINITY_DN17204_c0_g1_i1.p1 TRINITY_DN17204_c0_g1~~TRINITY_DN17204_c0_g1_i1.p1  ORF type:complete len:316 (-),score=123.40 TRINITY_DN17204_c0_g1_i1:153-1100(-)
MSKSGKSAVVEPVVVSEFHEAQLEGYLKFAAVKRSESLREADIAFRDAKAARLTAGNVYSSEEVSDVMDGVATVVKGDLQRDLSHTAHTTALVLKQFFVQAEEIMLDLHLDVSQLENEYLLQEIARVDDAIAAAPDKRLKAMSQVASDAALQHAMGAMKGQQVKVEDRFKKLQLQCTSILRQKTELEEQIEHLKTDLATAKGASASASAGATKPAGQATATVKDTASATDLQLYKDKTVALQKDLDLVTVKLRGESEKSARLEKELLKKVQGTTPFMNMKRMLKQKNDQLKELRAVVAKVAPDQLPPEPTIEDKE